MANFLAQCIRSRWTALGCAIVILASVLLPPEGPKLPLCYFKQVTNLPCFGCGLTRSWIGAGHLDLARAIHFHPVGFAGYMVVVTLFVLALTPSGIQNRAAAWVEARKSSIGIAAWCFLAAFLLYGLVRLGYCMWLKAELQPIPW